MLDTRRKAYLQAMGIDLWSAREPCVAVTPVVAKQVVISTVQTPEPLTENTSVNNLEWPDLLERVASCQQCSCCHSRMHSVFGSGNRQADLLIIAGAPDPDENQSGEPFVGKAGQMLNAMLKTIGFRRDQVYLTNLLKCHPAANRSPKVEEITACRAYLDRQIELVQPKMIIVMGEAAAQGLLCEKAGWICCVANCISIYQRIRQYLVAIIPRFYWITPKKKRKLGKICSFCIAS